jgi:hypothetical protein
MSSASARERPALSIDGMASRTVVTLKIPSLPSPVIATLDAGITDSATQQVLGDGMRVRERPFGLIDRVAEIVRHLPGAHVDAAEFGAGSSCLISCEIPAQRHAELGKRFDFRCQIEGPVVDGV